MQARTEALVGAGALIAVVVLAAALGARGDRLGQEDRRPSAFLSGPHGARGLAESLERLGIDVRRYRRGLRQLQPDPAVNGRTALLLLDPSTPIRGAEVELVRAWADATPEGGLVLAGRGAAQVMRCFGYALDWRFLDSVEVRSPSVEVEVGNWPRAAGVLASSSDTIVADSSRLEDTGVTECIVPPIARVDTLVTSVTGRVVALRLEREDTGGEVVVVADAGLFRNRALRDTPAGPFALSLFAGRYRRVIFEEAHHGFQEGGSLAGATLAWSLRSPWGWAMWQMGVVGLLALFGSAFRFGPPRRVIRRHRRSPVEHVRALATALAAARGHDVAIATIVEGLRRRLLPVGQRPQGGWQEWVGRLGQHAKSARAREAVTTLKTLTRPGQSPEGVLKAANAVEDVWQELRP
jgi:hypothetical protein